MIIAMTATRPRIAVDTNVLMEAESPRRVLLAADLGQLDPIWSPQIDAIDLRFEIARPAPIAPNDQEVAWAEASDPDDLHLQVLARTARADCVVSWNHRDLPARQVVHGRPCGELCGVLWITPDQLPSLRLTATEVAP
jgi:hypothetical protein